MIGCHSLVYELDEKGSAQSAGMKAAIGVVAVGQGVLCMGQIGQQHSILVHIRSLLPLVVAMLLIQKMATAALLEAPSSMTPAAPNLLRPHFESKHKSSNSGK